MHDKLDTLADLIEKRNANDFNSKWVESEVALKILGVSAKTLQTYRDLLVIPFSQNVRKIYINRADLDTSLRSHRIGSIANVCYNGKLHLCVAWSFKQQ